MEDARYEINAAVVYREIEGQILLMLPGEHDLYTLNNTGKLIWQAILDQRSLPETAVTIADRYDIPPELVVRDAQHLIDDLIARKIINEIA